MRYLLGIISGLLVGIIYNSSSLIQKYTVVNRDKDKPLLRQLLKHPLWVISILGSGVLAFAFTIFGQMMIGPTLIPGLAALGMIIIPIGASKYLNEKNGLTEYAGITMIIISVILLSFSRLSIDTESIQWLSEDMFLRTLRYIGGLTAAAVVLLIGGFMIRQKLHFRSILYSVSAGIALAIGNILTAPLSHQMTLMSRHSAGRNNLVYFIVLLIYIVAVNAYAVIIMQHAYTLSHVSVLMPVQQTPIQIIPILSHFYFFDAAFPSTYAKIAVPVAVIFILAGASALSSKSVTDR